MIYLNDAGFDPDSHENSKDQTEKEEFLHDTPRKAKRFL
jgi:hypothetical protein